MTADLSTPRLLELVHQGSVRQVFQQGPGAKKGAAPGREFEQLVRQSDQFEQSATGRCLQGGIRA
jgi:hypothetical protein